MHWLFVTIFVVSVIFAHGIEVSFRINTIKPINIIDDRFLSFVLDVERLDQSEIEKYQVLTAEMNAAYVKLSTVPLGLTMKCGSDSNNNSNNSTQDEDAILTWAALQQWMSSADWIPVIALPYDPSNWKLDKVFKILNAAAGSNLQSCVWQLGSEFQASDSLDYVKDLTTLQLIVDNLKPVENWQIIGADISSKSDPMETKLFSDLSQGMVEAISWTQSTETCDTIPNESTLKRFARCDLSAWLGVRNNQQFDQIAQNIEPFQEIESIRRLGEAARLGFKVTFRQIRNLERSLTYYGTLTFKRIMGNRVFDVRVIGKPESAINLYCHCTNDSPGSLSIMATNTGEERAKVSVKMSDTNTGSELWQYTLTIKDNKTFLNEEEIDYNSTFEPFIKIKHTTDPIQLTLPPMSVNFWILPQANNKQCLVDAVMNNSIKKYKRNALSYRPAICRSSSLLDRIKRRALQQKLSNRIFYRNQGKKCKCSTRATIGTRRKRSVSHSVLVVRNRANYVPKIYSVPSHAANERVYVINRNDVWNGPIISRDAEMQSEAETEQPQFEYLKAGKPIESIKNATHHVPKFIRYTSGKVTNFVKTVTDHITDWWNAWAV